MCSSIQKLSPIGTEVAIIPANSIHYAIEEILRISPIPVLNLVDLVANECITRGFKKIAILGVGITMSDGLYERSLMNVGVETITPSVEVQSELNDIIYNEIIPGIYTEETTQKIVNILDGLRSSGCDSVILGCTELPILITEANSSLPFIDTTRLLAIKSLEYSTN
jgi:aspartate racemase